MDSVTFFLLSFLAGIYAPVGAPCALILYPGYIAFLAGKSGEEGHRIAPFVLGLVVATGVIVAMLTGSLLFSYAVYAGGEAFRDVFIPAVFIILIILSLLLIFDINLGQVSGFHPIPGLENPIAAAFCLGMTFGIIILPCNSAAVALLLALASTASGLFEGLGAFLSFGLGITLPLLVLAALSQATNRRLMRFLTRYQRAIRLISGIIMLVIAAWYLTLFFASHLV
ncbi:MAG TPA: cytochrome c biogenesis protein CcdA [Methanoregula sp.]|nr:cytochrome c biogenesis protein CcdA [Methanoregula sp.]